MKIYKDIINGDEMCCDVFSMTVEYEDAIIKIPSKLVPKNFDPLDIFICDCMKKKDEVNKPEIERVINVVYISELKQIKMKKKEFKAYIKNYFKKIITYLEKNGKKNRIEGFKKGVQDFCNFINPIYNEIELYTGANGVNKEGEIIGGICISYWEDESASGPMFYFFKEGLKEETI